VLIFKETDLIKCAQKEQIQIQSRLASKTWVYLWIESWQAASVVDPHSAYLGTSKQKWDIRISEQRKSNHTRLLYHTSLKQLRSVCGSTSESGLFALERDDVAFILVDSIAVEATSATKSTTTTAVTETSATSAATEATTVSTAEATTSAAKATSAAAIATESTSSTEATTAAVSETSTATTAKVTLLVLRKIESNTSAINLLSV
jgi:hypothetical protein